MTDQGVSDATKRTIIKVRNAILFLIGVVLLGLGLGYLVLGIQGLGSQVSLIVGGLVMMLLAVLGWRFHWAEGRLRTP